MMKITGERKSAAARLAEITGGRAVYTKMPRCAYLIGPFAIERDGSVTASESADLAPLRTLAQEGLLEGWEEPVEETTKEAQESTTEAEDSAERAETTKPQETTTETQEGEPDRLIISLPLTGHTETSLRNLVTMVYSRGSLISKATGGTFSCTQSQVDALKGCISIPDLLTRITPELIGLDFSDGKVNFTGFPLIEDADRIKAFAQLAAQMNKMAKEQKRTMAKTVDAANEKYIFRIWLLALGMGGEEFKTARRVLLHPLTGSAAFKDQAMEERWKAKQAVKRDAAKAVKKRDTPVTEEETK
ncbi:MAG: hypothetical protein IJ899_18760 [Blautia sp.]|nr:hypothetical protein [Blautia sp.]